MPHNIRILCVIGSHFQRTVAFLISRYVEMHAMEDSHLSTVFDGYLDLIFCIFDLYFFEHFRALFSFFLFQHGTVFTVMFTLSITFGTIYTAAFMSIAADRPAIVLIMNYAAKLVVSISESIFFGLHNETKISSLLLIGWLFQVAITYRAHAMTEFSITRIEMNLRGGLIRTHLRPIFPKPCPLFVIGCSLIGCTRLIVIMWSSVYLFLDFENDAFKMLPRFAFH
ncbi:hypothetical protein T11_13766 [Trichinella zimbabwensis]|uniref:Uncharacterized protein n=1 Tax=Trichinella zimbabwensis TaxID=268475 RepID=A0A0V1HZV6_9BILA|nr:hypothetical protein T11_13766 [Trichinella zimbabwensis]